MSGNVINLRQVRKQKARRDKEEVAAQNRITFGRTKDEKRQTQKLNDKAERDLDQRKLSDPDDS